jgi:hypothetical protein
MPLAAVAAISLAVPGWAGVRCLAGASDCADPNTSIACGSTYATVSTGWECCCFDYNNDGCLHEVKCDYEDGKWTVLCPNPINPVVIDTYVYNCSSVYNCRASTVRCGSSVGNPDCLYDGGHDPGEGHAPGTTHELCDEAPY